MLYNRFGTGADVQLLVDAPDVCAHGLSPDVQFVSDFFVQKPVREQLQDFLFSGREILRLLFRLSHPVEGLNHLTGNGTGHG